jgi:hypothetical protein
MRNAARPQDVRPTRTLAPRLRAAVGCALLVGVVSGLGPRLVSFASAQQIPPAIDERFAGLQWTFARVRYNTFAGESRSNLRVGYWDEPWAIDEKIWQYPWLYMVEPSNLLLSEKDIVTLREHLLRGGTLTMDDFHGPYEWDLTVRQLKLVFPDREIVEIEPPHPIYTCFYKLDKYPQVPGLGSFFQGRTWEKGGFVPHLRGILDDTGRPMVLINWNTDMGDGMEWSNAEDYPGYVKWTALAYQMMINEVVYTLTH